MKILNNIKDIKRMFMVRDLFENKSIKVSWLDIISEYLKVDRKDYIEAQLAFLIDLNLRLECTLEEGTIKNLYLRFDEDRALVQEYLSKELGEDYDNYIKWEND
jgi:hypothetical protein